MLDTSGVSNVLDFDASPSPPAPGRPFAPAPPPSPGGAGGGDTFSLNVGVRTGALWVPTLIIQAASPFDVTLFGGDRVTLKSGGTVVPPIAVEWALHPGVAYGTRDNKCRSFDDNEVAATITVLKGATLDAALIRSGVLLTVEGALVNAYLLMARVVSNVVLDGTVTLTVLRGRYSGGGVRVQVGGFAG